MVEVYYGDLSYRIATESQAYPFKEMANEWIGIAGVYFGFSFLSLAFAIKRTWRLTKHTIKKVRSSNSFETVDVASPTSIK